MDLEKVHRRYVRLARKVDGQLAQLQQQRVEALAPSRLTLPAPWQPLTYHQPVVMYKVVAAQGGQITSVFDSRVVYQLHEWTHARAGCSSERCWPPLWSCMYAYPTAHQARRAVFPRGSQQQKGARVLCRVSVLGKGYSHPDGRVAVSQLRLEAFLEYLPKGPAEKVVHVVYTPVPQRSDLLRSSSNSKVGREASGAAAATAAVQLVPELQRAAWDVDEA